MDELKYGVVVKTIFYMDGVKTIYANGYEELVCSNYRKLYKIEGKEKVLLEYEEFTLPEIYE